MSIYMSWISCDKKTKTITSDGEEFRYTLEATLHKALGFKKWLVEIRGLDRFGISSSIVIDMNDLLELVACLLLERNALDSWCIVYIQLDEDIKGVKDEKRKD